MKNLDKIEKNLCKLKKKFKDVKYSVPSLWLEPSDSPTEKIIRINPVDFFLEKIKEIKELAKSIEKNPSSERTADAVVYNMSVRHATAFDHDGNGELIDGDGFRENGTFLKSVALLPYLKRLGIDTVHLLPITSIGRDGRKGELGSPYAIRNHYEPDENLGEPILELSTEEQFEAFCEAARALEMRIVLEFVFRTASKDADLALERPEMFYWIKDSIPDREPGSNDEDKYGPPIFTEVELKKIKEKVESGDLENLPKPHKVYREMFVPPPNKPKLDNGKIVGVSAGVKCRIPGAFADWPPDDNQPPWSDVTYLRIYDAPEFNYIAYNTIRMYDEKLAKSKNKVEKLWDYLEGIIPHYQNKYKIDGVLVDMGHALPDKLIKNIIAKARTKDPNFLFWQENFIFDERSIEDGYDAVVGYEPFDAHEPHKMRELIRRLEREGPKVPFFATCETHNTPRGASRPGGIEFSKAIFAVNAFLPAIPFLPSGYELGETTPINTGLGFTREDREKYPTEKLPLFSPAELPWDSDDEFTDYIKRVLEFRSEFIDRDNFDPKNSIKYVDAGNENLIAYIRNFPKKGGSVIAIMNYDPEETLETDLEMCDYILQIYDPIRDRSYPTKNSRLKIKLKPFSAIIGKIE